MKEYMLSVYIKAEKQLLSSDKLMLDKLGLVLNKSYQRIMLDDLTELCSHGFERVIVTEGYYIDIEVLDWNKGLFKRISPLFDTYQEALSWEAPKGYLDEDLFVCSVDVTMENKQPSVGEL